MRMVLGLMAALARRSSDSQRDKELVDRAKKMVEDWEKAHAKPPRAPNGANRHQTRATSKAVAD